MATNASTRRRPDRTALPKKRRGAPWAARNDQSRVGVRELRQNLSVYLDRVKEGGTLSVTEHGVVVALLTPALAASLSTLERMVAEGRATAPTRSLGERRPPRPAQPGARPSEEILAEFGEDRLP